MDQVDILKPIRIFGYFIAGLGFVGLIVHFAALGDPRYTLDFEILVLVVSFLHIFAGIGVILKTRWGFYALKIFLYSLYFMVPISTYVAIKTLKYIKTHNIEKYFR